MFSYLFIYQSVGDLENVEGVSYNFDIHGICINAVSYFKN